MNSGSNPYKISNINDNNNVNTSNSNSQAHSSYFIPSYSQSSLDVASLSIILSRFQSIIQLRVLDLLIQLSNLFQVS